MPDTAQLTLPVLPLHNGVVFPHMVVTIRVETEEGKTTLAAASRSDGRLLLVPKLEGRYSTVGTIAEIQSESRNQKSEITSPFKGILRGLIHNGVPVTQGMKIGDVDPRDDPSACFLVSDKALSIGGGVLEAILTREEIRAKLWN